MRTAIADKRIANTFISDLTNDRRSLERRLDDSLFLIVKRNRKDNSWQFPQGKWVEGETMRDTAERVLYRAVGKNRFWFPGNCPMGHFCYEYPEELKKQRKNFGAKLFFHRAVLLPNTRLKIETRLYTDYAWIARLVVMMVITALLFCSPAWCLVSFH